MAPPIDVPTSITLRIKVAPGNGDSGADEFTLGSDVATNLTLGQVRQQIQQAIPSNPSPERQRLLYGGRALVDNEQSLADALNTRRDPSQREYVVHLLIKGEGQNTAPPVRTSTSQAASSAANPPPQHNHPAPQQQQHQYPQHDHPYAQHMAQHQAAVLAQQQRIQVHAAHLLEMQNARQMLPPGMPLPMQNVQFGGGGMQAMPLQHEQQLYTGRPNFPLPPTPQNGQSGSTPGDPSQLESRNTPTTGDGSLPNPQQQPRSSSQPPPQGVGNSGVQIEGIGPNGHRVSIQTQTLHFPNGGIPGQHPMHQGQHIMPSFAIPHLHGLPQQPARRTGPSALDQARDNIMQMRQMLNELRGLDMTTEEQRARIDGLEQRTQSLNEYIDPLQLGSANRNRPSRTVTPGTAHPFAHLQATDVPRSNSQPPPGLPQMWQQPAQGVHQTPAVNASDVDCYLLSSPTGPHALVYTPQGAYTGNLPYASQVLTGLRPPGATIAGATPPAANTPPPQDQALVAGPVAPAPPGQQQLPGQAELPNPLAPLINHVWLLLRVLIFAYFLLGSNMGWRRPLALFAIGAGFWMIRQGLLGDGGALRRWWEGIVNEQQPAEGQGQGQGRAGPAPGQMPTPAQVAQRLLNEENRVRDDRLSWLREQIRPIERAIALLVASLWPGVGEAYVRNREEEERRRNEAEIEARRQEEEARKAREDEEEKEKAAEGSSGVGEGERSEKVEAGFGEGTASTSEREQTQSATASSSVAEEKPSADGA